MLLDCADLEVLWQTCRPQGLEIHVQICNGAIVLHLALLCPSTLLWFAFIGVPIDTTALLWKFLSSTDQVQPPHRRYRFSDCEQSDLGNCPRRDNLRKWLEEGAQGLLDSGSKGLPRVFCKAAQELNWNWKRRDRFSKNRQRNRNRRNRCPGTELEPSLC